MRLPRVLVGALASAALLLAAAPARAAADGARTYRLDPSTGSLRVLLYKGGPLAFLGHDHVVWAPAFSGEVQLSSAAARMTLTIDATKLVIDTAPVRVEEGYGPLKDSDLAKIDAGMRGPKGLDVARFPEISFRSESIEPVAGEKALWQVAGRLVLHGVTQSIDFPVTVSDGPDGGKWFSGYVRLRPSDFGVKPFKVLGGAITLTDQAFVRFTVLGR